jgi:hypothetical protein
MSQEENLIKPIRVEIKSFQSIDHLDFEIRGFTCITGKTNIGKSAVVRAISSAILNNPVVGMVRKGAPYASVDLTSDSWAFRWEKSERGINRYTIGDKTYDKVGQRQLPEIADMGFRSVKVGQDDVSPWLAPQFSPIFLLDKSGPQVTDFISEVSRLNVLQDAVVISARGKKKSNDEANLKAGEAAAFRRKQASVAGVGDVVKSVAELDEQAASIEEYEARASLAESVLSRLRTGAASVDALRKAAAVSVPAAPDASALAAVAAGESLARGLETAARSVIAVRKSSGVTVPAAPPEAAAILEAEKFAHIPAEAKRVAKLEAVSKAKVPALKAEAFTAMFEAAAHESRIRAAAAALSGFSDVAVPDALPAEAVSGVAAAEAAEERLRRAAEDVKAAAAPAKKAAKDLAELDDEISKIPVCPTCKRPGGAAAAHGHAG